MLIIWLIKNERNHFPWAHFAREYSPALSWQHKFSSAIRVQKLYASAVFEPFAILTGHESCHCQLIFEKYGLLFAAWISHKQYWNLFELRFIWIRIVYIEIELPSTIQHKYKKKFQNGLLRKQPEYKPDSIWIFLYWQ